MSKCRGLAGHDVAAYGTEQCLVGLVDGLVDGLQLEAEDVVEVVQSRAESRHRGVCVYAQCKGRMLRFARCADGMQVVGLAATPVDTHGNTCR